jgi:hypothetical protein
LREIRLKNRQEANKPLTQIRKAYMLLGLTGLAGSKHDQCHKQENRQSSTVPELRLRLLLVRLFSLSPELQNFWKTVLGSKWV